MFATQFEFLLPKGYIEPDGSLHRDGTMRLATAIDEIAPAKEAKVQSNAAYLVVILLSRVITRLGTVQAINPKVIEGLFVEDLAYLQDFYNRINGGHSRAFTVVCPQCQHGFQVEPEIEGES